MKNETKPVASNSACNDGFYFQETGKCYVYFKTEKVSWDDARVQCMKKKNGDLATIADQATQDFVKTSFALSTYSWIGGVKRSGKWTWADGTPWTWHLSINDESGQDYLLMSANQWHDCYLDHNGCKFPYLCQY